MEWFRNLTTRLRSDAEKIRVLAVLAEARDRACLDAIAAQEHWELKLSESCDSAREALKHYRADVILCDRDLNGCNWRDAITMLAASDNRTILATPTMDDKLWLEVIERGGFDVITRPFHEHRVIQTVTTAWNELRK
jgi:DNA-binding NtrC family response regulator